MTGGDDRDRTDPFRGRRLGEDTVDSHTADVLSRALAREAARVTPAGDGLQQIRARTARPGRRPGWLLPLAAVAASAAVIGAAGWVASTGGDAPSASNGPSRGDNDAGPDADPTVLTTVAPEGTPVALPVYYVGAQGGDGTEDEFRLFREFHPTTAAQAPDAETRVELALREMFAASPADPDYHEAAWPVGTDVRSVLIDDSARLITVDLTGVDTAALSAEAADARATMSVQQLVFTATAAASIGSAATDAPFEVQILVDGERVEDVLGTAAGAPLRRDTAASRAAIWILSIAENQTVTSPITVSGEANLSEGGIGRWELARNGVVISSGDVETVKCCSWEPFSFVLADASLKPGTYEVRIYDSRTALADTKDFSIEKLAS